METKIKYHKPAIDLEAYEIGGKLQFKQGKVWEIIAYTKNGNLKLKLEEE